MKATGERFIPDADMGASIELEHMHRYYAIAPHLKGKYVLDAACGVGYGTKIISKYAKHVVGIDIDYKSIKYAENLYSNNNLEFLQMSVDKITFKNSLFDAIVSFETIEHISQEQQFLFLEKAVELIKEDGYLIISTPDVDVFKKKSGGTYYNPFHIKEYGREEFIAILQKYFPFVEMHTQECMLCSVISGTGKEQLNEVPEISMGHYLIAVCSKVPVSISLGSVFLPSSEEMEVNRQKNAERRVEELNSAYHIETVHREAAERHAKELDNAYQIEATKREAAERYAEKLDQAYRTETAQREALEKHIEELNKAYRTEAVQREALERRVEELNKAYQTEAVQREALEGRVEELNKAYQTEAVQREVLEGRAEELNKAYQTEAVQREALEGRVEELNKAYQTEAEEREVLIRQVESLNKAYQIEAEKRKEADRAIQAMKTGLSGWLLKILGK